MVVPQWLKAKHVLEAITCAFIIAGVILAFYRFFTGT